MHSLNFPNFSKKLRVFLGIEALKLFSRSRKNNAQLLFQVKLRNAQHDFESSNFEIFVNGIYLVLCSFNQSFHWQVHFHSFKFEREKPRIRRQSFVYETLYYMPCLFWWPDWARNQGNITFPSNLRLLNVKNREIL